MGVRILYDRQNEMACLYCSTSGFAFGPTFLDGDKEQEYKDADERAEAFCRWLDSPACDWQSLDRHKLIDRGNHDPRVLTDSGLETAYGQWLDQEVAQYAREQAAEDAKYAELDS